MSHHFRIFINQSPYTFEHQQVAVRALKERACIPLDHALCMQHPHHHPHQECGCENNGAGNELLLLDNEQTVTLEEELRLWSVAPVAHDGVTVKINHTEYEFADAHQTGRSLKERAGIALTDVLFLDRPREDDVIADDKTITLKCGECFHSEPPANYGHTGIDAAVLGFEQFEVFPQPDGWMFVVLNGYPVPEGYTPNVARLLVKLPPLFPEAAPDMFWVSPQLRTSSGTLPQGTCNETLLGGEWQRFSWHLLPGAWTPGISTLRDFMRCVRGRLEKRN